MAAIPAPVDVTVKRQVAWDHGQGTTVIEPGAYELHYISLMDRDGTELIKYGALVHKETGVHHHPHELEIAQWEKDGAIEFHDE